MEERGMNERIRMLRRQSENTEPRKTEGTVPPHKKGGKE